jgi:AcrR family transcriptional regulator
MATQAERRSATRAKLLDAAMDTLVERGVVGFTTTEVGQRAGVSHGTIFRHFPTKADLLGATIGHLYSGLRTRYEDQAAGLRADLEPAARLRIGVVLLWEVLQDEKMQATYDLYAAARTDDALRTRLCEVVQENSVHFHALAQALFGDASTVDPERFHTVVDLVACTMQGMVSDPLGVTDVAYQRNVLCLLADLAIEAVGAGDSAPPAIPLSRLAVAGRRP